MKKSLLLVAALLCAAATFAPRFVAPAADAASIVAVDPVLEKFFAAQTLPGAKLPAVITYSIRPGSSEFARLQSIGILKGYALQQLPMVIADVNAAQLRALRTQPGVVSLWANQTLELYASENMQIIGAERMRADREIQKSNPANPGQSASGKNVGIGYIDTGIDGTQRDLEYGSKIAQNVQQPLASGVVSAAGLVAAPGVSISDLIAGTGFVPPVYLENVPTSDIESGHGTHGAGVAAGTGVTSGGLYGGVAPGAKLIGVQAGDDKGLPLVAILGAFDYLLANQFLYNVRVINNSWGSRYSAAGVNPLNPINVATRAAHDRNIVVVFAAGNAGDTATSINPYSTMPWTFSVAAGEKRGLGTPASFSSRGINEGEGTDTTSQPADPEAVPNLRPDITAPGVAIVSVRAHAPAPLMSAGGVLNNDVQNIAPAYLPFYLSSQGTSFAAPHVSGAVACLLEVRPELTPAEVFTILRQTATPMPYTERVVGAGYLDVHNAVRAAMQLTAVEHPANLFPDANAPEITDATDDQTGTTAQDIVSGDFAYDASARQLIYALTLRDLSVKSANMRWTMSSQFGATEVFVQASLDAQGSARFEYGKFAVLETGTRQQQRLGAADAGEINGNRITIRLALDKVNAVVSADVLYTTSTNTQAVSQILVGSPVNPGLPVSGLLLNADSAAGREFSVGTRPDAEPTPTPTPERTPTPTPEPTPTPTPEATPEATPVPTPTPTPETTPEPTPAPTPTPQPTPSPTPSPSPEPAPEGDKFTERFSGQLVPGQGPVSFAFALRRATLEAQINLNHGNEPVAFELYDAASRLVARGDGRDKKFTLSNLPPGTYTYRVSGLVNRAVDFTIKSTQGK